MSRKIRMKSLASGPAGTFEANQVYVVGKHLTPSMAKGFVAGGVAEWVQQSQVEAQREAAALSPPERADRPPAQSRVPAIIIERLEQAGYNPAHLGEVEDEALLEVDGVGPATLKRLRGE